MRFLSINEKFSQCMNPCLSDENLGWGKIVALIERCLSVDPTGPLARIMDERAYAVLRAAYEFWILAQATYVWERFASLEECRDTVEGLIDSRSPQFEPHGE